MLNKKSVDDINVKGKKVLCRCDFNVPLIDGKITDENRLVAALPTIKKLIADGGRVILCSHLGKPKGEPKPELSLAPVAVRLSELLDQEVKFVPSDVVVDDSVKAAVDAMKDGEVILLQNTRYRAEETKNGEAFSKELASLCDVFVNDAFGTAHRAHCSNVGVTQFVDTAVVGYLMQKEIDFLGNAVREKCLSHTCAAGKEDAVSFCRILLRKLTALPHHHIHVGPLCHAQLRNFLGIIVKIKAEMVKVLLF